jgi:hypothetical protein
MFAPRNLREIALTASFTSGQPGLTKRDAAHRMMSAVPRRADLSHGRDKKLAVAAILVTAGIYAFHLMKPTS